MSSDTPRDLSIWPILPREKREALDYAIRHFTTTQPDIAQALQAVLDDINHEQKLNDMRLHAGEGPSE